MNDSSWLGTAATWLAGLSIMLVVVNAGLMLRNQDAQREVSQRQATINQAAQVARVNQLLIETAVRAAIERKDDPLLALLEHHGVKISRTPAPSGKAP